MSKAICKLCHTEFSYKPSSSTGQYCNWDCYNEARRTVLYQEFQQRMLRARQAWINQQIAARGRYEPFTEGEKSTRYRDVRQGAMLWYKMTRGCVDCGITDPRVLDFDHVNGEKKFVLKHGKGKPLPELLVEVQKCEVVCANCHRLRTQARMNGSTTFDKLGLKALFR